MRGNRGFKKISIILLTIFLISNYNVKAAESQIDLMDINRNTNVQSIKKGDTFNVTYKIEPKAIDAATFNNNKQKDIILVIDTSGSMEYIPTKDREPYYYGEKSRLDIMKNTARNFITKFMDDGKAKIGLVAYNTAASELSKTVNVKSNNIDDLKYALNELYADGSTNIGDGLRTAYYMIADNAQGHDKYIILMTDGEAEAYSSSDRAGYNYFMDAKGPKYNFETLWDDYWVWDGFWNGHWQKFANPDYRDKSLNYAKKVASEKISPSKIKTFVVGFGSGSANDKNKQIADAAGGQYYQALDENSINNIYNEIQKYVEANISASAHFEETFSSNLEVVNSDGLPNGLRVSGSKIAGDINNIYYTLNDNKTNYTAKPIEFTVTYRAKDDINGNYILGENNSSFVRYNVSYDDKNDKQTKYFNELRIGKQINTKVDIEVNDARGLVDKYDTDEKPNQSRYDKFFDSGKKLQGEAYAQINYIGSFSNLLQYQFINANSNPSGAMPSSGWIDINLKQEDLNDDVVTEKQGYLNWRGYDVNHMETMGNAGNWEKPELVFKYPYAATSYKYAGYSGSKDQYGQWVDIPPYTIENKTVTKKWVTNSIFMSNMDIGGDYKEASKLWGYIKVPKDGNYSFGANSDDGCVCYITVDGSTEKFVDMFKVQSSTWGTTGKVFNLKADRYYPIYIEYFNWGGWANFEMKYSDSYTVNQYSNNVPTEWFYPSKNITPGEYAQTIFTGSAGVKFPQEPGSYYIAYRAAKKDSIGNVSTEKEGYYGPFTVESKAKFILNREVDDSNKNPKTGDVIKINYTIEPQNIPVKSIYKNLSDAADSYSITIKDFRYDEEFPIGMKPLDSEGFSVNGQRISYDFNNISSIIYTLDKPTNNIDDAFYKAQPINYSVSLKVSEAKEYILESMKSAVTYSEFDGAKKQANFSELIINVSSDNKIIDHGIYNEKLSGYIKKSDKNNTYNITNRIPIKMAVKVEINSNNPEIKLNLAGDFVKENIAFEKYELNNDGTINYNSLQKFSLPLETSNSGTSNIVIKSSDQIKFEPKKDYILIYSIKPQKDNNNIITINPYIDNKPFGDLNLKLNIIDLPILQ